jgi:hypothetical protein
MKKLLFVLSIAALLMACDKEEDKVEFEATDVTGTTIVSGYATKNVIISQNGAWVTTGVIPAEGVKVTIVVDKSELYPNANVDGSDVYTGLTDADGKYSIAVKSNADGVDATIKFETYVATLDTLFNGELKTGQAATFNGAWSYPTLMKNVPYEQSCTYIGAVIVNEPKEVEIGIATVRGFIKENYLYYEREYDTVDSVWVYNDKGTKAMPLAGMTVEMEVLKDPTTNDKRIYTTTTNSSGFYEFEIETVKTGTTGFATQTGTIRLYDYETTQDTLKRHDDYPTVADQIVTGVSGVYQAPANVTKNNLFTGTIETNVVLTYTTFEADE